MGDPALARRRAVARGRAIELGDVGPLAKGADRREQLVHVLGPELDGVAHAGVQGDAPQRPLRGEPGRDGVETQPAALLGDQVDAEVDPERPCDLGQAQVAEREQPVVVQA